MNMKSENLKILGQLLGCYLHQDWTDEFETADQAIRAIVINEPREELLIGAKVIDGLLASNQSEADLRSIMVDKIGCYFDPQSEGLTYAVWLRNIHEILANAE